MRLSPFSPILRAKPRGAHAGTGHDALEVTRYISYGIAGGDPVLRRREGGDDRKSPMSGLGQKAKNSLRANVFRCSSNNGPSWPGPSKALGEIRGLLLSLVGERFEPKANCSASYCARPFVFRTVLKLRSTKLWRKMSSPTTNCGLFGNL